MAVAKVNLKAKKEDSNNKMEIKFHFANHNGSVITASELAKYRVVVHVWTDIPLNNISNFVAFKDETGYDKQSWYEGNMELQDIVSRHYNSISHPACITSGLMFRHTVMARLSPVGMTNGMPDANYIEGFSLGIRNSSWKDILLDNSGNKVSDLSYSMNGLTTSYADNAHIILEYNNGGDETDMDDANWEVVQEYTDSTTQDANTGTHPYEGTSSYYQNVNDHKFLVATEATWIDSVSADTANGSGGSPDPLYMYGEWWNGSVNVNRRVLLKFDMSGLSVNDTIDTAKICVVSDSGNIQAGQMNLVQISGSWSETGATWNNSNSLYSTQQAYKTLRGSSDEANSFMFVDANSSYIAGQVSGNNYGHGLLHNSESGGVTRSFEGRGVSGLEPVLLIKYSTSARRIMII